MQHWPKKYRRNSFEKFRNIAWKEQVTMIFDFRVLAVSYMYTSTITTKIGIEFDTVSLEETVFWTYRWAFIMIDWSICKEIVACIGQRAFWNDFWEPTPLSKFKGFGCIETYFTSAETNCFCNIFVELFMENRFPSLVYAGIDTLQTSFWLRPQRLSRKLLLQIFFLLHNFKGICSVL